MTDMEYAAQASFSIPHSGSDYAKADMVNVRGNSVQELHGNLVQINDHCLTLIAEVGKNLRAVALVTDGLDAQHVQTERHEQPQSQQQPPPQQSQGQQSPPWEPQGQQQSAPQGQQQSAPQGSGGGQWQGQQGGQQNGSQQPQQGGGGIPTEPPPHVGPAPQCSHGTKRFLAKPYKGGKPGYWMAWACPAQRGDQTQHDLEFIRNS